MRALVKSVVPVAVRASPWGSVVRTPSIMQETWQELWVRSLGQEDPLEEEMATLSSILTWTIPWTEETCGQQFTCHRELDRI